jgi:hypothetical protein
VETVSVHIDRADTAHHSRAFRDTSQIRRADISEMFGLIGWFSEHWGPDTIGLRDVLDEGLASSLVGNAFSAFHVGPVLFSRSASTFAKGCDPESEDAQGGCALSGSGPAGGDDSDVDAASVASHGSSRSWGVGLARKWCASLASAQFLDPKLQPILVIAKSLVIHPLGSSLSGNCRTGRCIAAPAAPLRTSTHVQRGPHFCML